MQWRDGPERWRLWPRWVMLLHITNASASFSSFMASLVNDHIVSHCCGYEGWALLGLHVRKPLSACRWAGSCHRRYLSRLTTKTKNDLCAQRRFRWAWASAQSDQSSLSAWRNIGSSATHWAPCEDWSDQTGWMTSLIGVFAGHIDHFVGFVVKRLIFAFGPS